jgi:hypothetical protein
VGNPNGSGDKRNRNESVNSIGQTLRLSGGISNSKRQNMEKGTIKHRNDSSHKLPFRDIEVVEEEEMELGSEGNLDVDDIGMEDIEESAGLTKRMNTYILGA